jgi:hypothetical protein
VENVSLQSSLRTPEDRTHAIGEVIKSLGEMIPGIRNELYPVTSSYGMPVYFSLERAAAPYFGIKVCCTFFLFLKKVCSTYIAFFMTRVCQILYTSIGAIQLLILSSCTPNLLTFFLSLYLVAVLLPQFVTVRSFSFLNKFIFMTGLRSSYEWVC